MEGGLLSPPQSPRCASFDKLGTGLSGGRKPAPRFGQMTMQKNLVLAIDQGTSSTKCLLLNAAGHIVARGSAPLGETYPQPGWVSQDALEIWESVRLAVSNCLQGQDASAVAAVGLSTQRESYVAWQRSDGAPLGPVISWQDQRTIALCEARRNKDVETMVREASGLPLDPMFSASKACWLLDSIDPDRRRAKAGEICLGTIDSFLLSRFGGAHVTEAGNASRTQLLNVRSADWDQDLLTLFDIPRQALPEVMPSHGPFPAVRGLHPLPDGVPVLAVMGDSHSALFAHGAFEPGEVKATMGTGSSIMGLVDRAETRADTGLCLTIAWQLERVAYAAEGNVRSCGSTLRWLAKLFGSTPEALAEEGAAVSSKGVCVVPGFNGLGAPWWDGEAVGLISGVTLDTDRAVLARATLESMVHQVADVVEAIDRGFGRVTRLHTDGGPTRSNPLMQWLADFVDRPVLRATQAELSALGVAHMAAWQAGLWSWDELRALNRNNDLFDPRLPEAERKSARENWQHAVLRARLRMASGD